MNKCIKIGSVLLILGLLLLTAVSCGAPGSNPWHSSNVIYISDLPSGDQVFVPLKVKQWGDPLKCHFGAKESAEEILNLIETETGAPISLRTFVSSDGVKGSLLEIPGDHTVFQNFYDTGRDYHKKGIKEYEMQGCDVMLLPNGDIESEATIMFPLAILDAPYDDYSFYPEQLQTGEAYKLIDTDINGVNADHLELLEEFYDKLECYSVERISIDGLLVTADEDFIKSLYDDNSPSLSFYIGSFMIKIKDGSVYFYSEND